MQRLADKLKRTDLPTFVPGDQVRVQVKIKEGDKERLQAFEGLVIAINKGPQGTFTVRKMSFGQGVERIFPFNSKVVDKVEKIRSYKVRRSKLFYIRGLRGKAARLKEVERDGQGVGDRFSKQENPGFRPGFSFVLRSSFRSWRSVFAGVFVQSLGVTGFLGLRPGPWSQRCRPFRMSHSRRHRRLDGFISWNPPGCV